MEYRALSVIEARTIRAALGPFIAANWDLLPHWKPELRDTIIDAAKKLHTKDFEFVRPGTLHVLATRGDNVYAVTPELQAGVTMEHVRAALKTFEPWGWWRFFKHNLIYLFILTMSTKALLFPLDVHLDPEWLQFILSSPWFHSALTVLSAGTLMWNFYMDNPVRHYREQALFCQGILVHLSQKTAQEIKADNAHLLRNMPTKEQVMVSQGLKPGKPKPA